jgi:hypothetical protein
MCGTVVLKPADGGHITGHAHKAFHSKKQNRKNNPDLKKLGPQKTDKALQI